MANEYSVISTGTEGGTVSLGRKNLAQKALDLVDNQVVLRVAQHDFSPGCDVRLADVGGRLSQAVEQEILALKRPPELDLRPFLFGRIVAIGQGIDTRIGFHFCNGWCRVAVYLKAAPD